MAKQESEENQTLVSQIHRRKIIYVSTFFLLFIGYFILRNSNWQGSTELHTIMEVIASGLAFFVGVMALVHHYTDKNNTMLFIGTGFIGTSLLDVYHALVTSSYFAKEFPSAPSSLIPWSWIASRMYLSVLLFLSWFTWRREDNIGIKGRISEKWIYTVTGSILIFTFLFFIFVPLPRAYYPEFFFHRPEELLPALFFLLALIGYLRKGYWKDDEFEHWLVLSLIIAFMGQSMFMSFSNQLFDFEFDAAHLLKKASYICVLTGLLISMYNMFKELEKQNLKLNEITANLKRSNIELEQFAYVASHDLQEPLRAISSYMQLLQRKYLGKIDEKADKYINGAIAGASSMRILINDLLTFSRIGRTQKDKITRNNFENILEIVKHNLSKIIEEKNAIITADPLPILKVEKSLMIQLFQNLIGNALKFTIDKIPVIHIGASKKGTDWIFYVKDNGLGIEQQYFGRIFLIFQRLHSKSEFSGTGIGLAICQKIVQRNKGRIWVESNINEGSTFYFSIPRG